MCNHIEKGMKLDREVEAVMQLQYTLLYCLKQLNGERTVSSIYYLLKGKRSSQTLQDGNMFQISFCLGFISH